MQSIRDIEKSIEDHIVEISPSSNGRGIQEDGSKEHQHIRDKHKGNTQKIQTHSITTTINKDSQRMTKKKMWKLFDKERNKVFLHEECIPIENEQIYQLCHVCHFPLFLMEDHIPQCTNTSCGMMYKHILDHSPEWRFFNTNDKHHSDPTRCGNPINELLLDSSLGCKILCNQVSSYQMKRLRKWTEWQATTHKEKSLYEEFQFITIMAQNAGIPKIFIDHAMSIHKDMLEQRMFRGMNRDGIKSASIYIACRLNGCPRTPHEIAEIFKLDKHSATYGCSTAVNILNNIERNLEPSQRIELMTTKPSDFIDRYSSSLGVPENASLLAKFVANKIEQERMIMDNTPQALAAGILFFVIQVCHLEWTKKDVKQICGISEVTINKCFKKLNALKEQIVPSCFL
jgi:transcription initiation factor TFIIB